MSDALILLGGGLVVAAAFMVMIIPDGIRYMQAQALERRRSSFVLVDNSVTKLAATLGEFGAAAVRAGDALQAMSDAFAKAEALERAERFDRHA